MTDPRRTRELWWARVRIALGTSQIVGAVAMLLLLARTGASPFTIAMGIVTAALVAISLLLFRGA